ncbi:MAG TPA: elongation factor P maturation arginine rhamnosyltransferase EarP [Ramlibacter sp.]|jgi:uncharacterized repeat protein (TIGR03837 family)
MRWDLFCRVIDNHGDAGVCWRLAAELAARGEGVRLWIDDPSPLAFMAPQGAPGVQVIHWTDAPPDLPPGDVVVEAFGCDPPAAFVARMADAPLAPAWINLEYLSAEGYVERNHGLPSPAARLVKHFFYPGFTPRTGGLLRERDWPARHAAFDRDAWLRRMGVAAPADRVISLFCYEPAALPDLLRQLAAHPAPTDLLVTAGRATAATRDALARIGPPGHLRLHWLPLLSQREYDHLLWACDFNFVRGEDSLARALLAGAPFAWQIYPQDDAAHHAKLEAFLAWLQPPPDLGRFFRVWNGMADAPLPPLDLAAWSEAASAWAPRVQAVPELATTLQRFVAGQARI